MKTSKWNSEAQLRRFKGQPPAPRVRFTLRLPKPLYARCEKLAERDGTLLNEWIRQVLEREIVS